MRKGGSETKGATMTITLEVPPHLETRLREYLASGDPAEMERLLATAITNAAASLLWAREHPPLSLDEYDAVVAELDAHFDACAEPGTASLPDEAFTRESIYGDHP
jgi:antitoxin ParD1/3/4